MIWNPFKKKADTSASKPEQSSKSSKKETLEERLEREMESLPAVFKSKLQDPTIKKRLMDIAKRMEADGVNFKSIRQMKKWMKDHEKELREENPEAQPKVETVVHEGPRIGRNDPCPCGSGKKYKKCCGIGK